MTSIRYTRNCFLRGMCVVYLFAFTSFYVQIPGLYGNNGVLPARTQLESRSELLQAKLQAKPTLLWLAPYVGLDTGYMMDVLALLGVLLSFTGFISQKFCTAPMFAGLWSLYYSFYQVGQTFMWFQWDILLLEAGFLSILVAPLRYGATLRRKVGVQGTPSDAVSFWLVRWLLFRLMFASAIVKLTSGCPTWWGLTALSVHFESQCIPTPLAWYSHHLPGWFLRLGTVHANIIEMFMPLLFFIPVRGVNIVNFYNQLLLQVCIILTGNYNFFNLLTIVLCFSLLDDHFFMGKKPPAKLSKKEKAAQANASHLPGILSTLFTVIVYAGVLYATYVLYNIKLNTSGGSITVDSKIGFTRAEFDYALGKAIPGIIVIGLTSLSLVILRAVYYSLRDNQGLSRVTTLVTTVLYSAAALGVFSLSTVPFSTLHPSGNTTVLPNVRYWHNRLEHLHLTNAYGLFRSMTGVGGRPEVIIEGSDSLEGPWKEYNFLYKPGNVNSTLPFVAPHQPRLDWQMWFASLGTYHQNPWLMSLAYRLLTGQPEVLQLLDTAHNPFPNKPPKYVKASLYTYHYTPWSKRSSATWWTRERKGEYFPTFSREHPPLLEYLSNLRILPAEPTRQVTPWLRTILDQIRSLISRIEPSILCWSVFSAGIAIIATGGSRK